MRKIAFIGFGEAASAFVEGWGAPSMAIRAYDIKTDDPALRDAKHAQYAKAGVTGCDTIEAALEGAELVFSLVTADQAAMAAENAAKYIGRDVLFLDCNSCAPGTKRASEKIISAAGGRYADVAVMAPVYPARHKVPLLLSGPHGEAALEMLTTLDMSGKITPGEVGAASSVKMMRSIMVKGMEALMMECMLSARRAGVDEIVLDSLQASHPGFNWKEQAAYMMERVMVHGERRAAEMREVALTVDQTGLAGHMARAIVEWQQSVGELHLEATSDDYKILAGAILPRLLKNEEQKS